MQAARIELWARLGISGFTGLIGGGRRRWERYGREVAGDGLGSQLRQGAERDTAAVIVADKAAVQKLEARGREGEMRAGLLQFLFSSSLFRFLHSSHLLFSLFFSRQREGAICERGNRTGLDGWARVE